MFELTVAKDGSGNYTTIQEALNAVEYRESAVIYIKEGIYRDGP